MSDQTIESLSIELRSDSKNAEDGIDRLVRSLGKLKSATKGGFGLGRIANQVKNLGDSAKSVNGETARNVDALGRAMERFSRLSNIKLSPSVSKQIRAIGDAVKSIQGTNFQDIDLMAQSLTSLSQIPKTNLTGTINQIQKLSETMTKINWSDTSGYRESMQAIASALIPLSQIPKGNLSGYVGYLGKIPEVFHKLSSVNVGASSSKIRELVEALKPLSEMPKQNISSTLTNLKKIPQIFKELQSVDMGAFSSKIRELTTALTPLATQMSAIASGFASFPSRIQRVIQGNQNLTMSNKVLSLSFIGLYAKMRLIAFTFSRLGHSVAYFITKSNDYIENMNLFHASMGEYAKEAEKYAHKVEELVGIDPGEWMRNQGIFMTLATGFGVAGDRAARMSKQLTQLGYDLSSFFNISYHDAMTKLQSGLAGELEPLRRLGYDLSQVKLQNIAENLGITKNFREMTQAEKAMLRYHAIMTQVTTAHGDMARTLEAPANQLRILKSQIEQAARAIGSIFIPILNKILPYLIAVAKVIKLIATIIGRLFGFSMPDIDYSGIEHVGGAADGAAESMDKAGKAAKKLKQYVMGFDELNIIDPTAGGGGGGTGGGGASGFDFETPEYDFLKNLNTGKIDEIVNKFKKWLGLTDKINSWADFFNTRLGKIVKMVGIIGSMLLAWKIGKGLFNAFNNLLQILGRLTGTSGLLGLLTWKDKLRILGGAIMTLAGSLLYLDGLFDAFINGNKWSNFAKRIGGLTLVVVGLYNMIKPFSSTMAKMVASLTAAVGGLIEFEIGLSGLKKHGATLNNIVSTLGGLALTVGGLYIAFKNATSPLVQALGFIVGFIQSMRLLGTAIADIVKNGASVGNVFLAIAGGIAAATLGFKAFMAIWAVSPFGAIALVLAGIGVAIKSFTNSLRESAKASMEADEGFQTMKHMLEEATKAAERSEQSLSNLNNHLEKLGEVSRDFGVAKQLVNEIFAISNNANASALELEKMRVKVDILNGMNIEGLKLSIDETTGRVKESKQAVEELIQKLEEKARVEAITQLVVEAYKGQYQALVDINRINGQVKASEEEIASTREKLKNTKWYDFAEKTRWNDQLKEEESILTQLKEKQETIKKTYYETTDAIKTYTDEMVNLKKEEMGVGDNAIDGLKNLQSTLDGVASEMPQKGINIAEGLKKGVEEGIKEQEYKSIWQKIGDWFNFFFGIHSPSTVFAEKGQFLAMGLINGWKASFDQMKSIFFETLQSLLNYITPSMDNIQKSFSSTWDIIKTETSVKWESIKATVGTHWEAIKTKAKDTWDGIKTNIKEAWDSTKQDTSTVWNDIKSTLGGSFTEISNNAKNTFENMKSTIMNIWSNLKDGISGIMRGIGDTVRNLKDRAVEGVNDAMRRLRDIGNKSPNYNYGDRERIDDRKRRRIRGFATGGFPARGELFLAREAGAEMVGSIGGRTAVANNQQIVSGVAHGVAEANREQNALLREQNDLLRAMLSKENKIVLDGREISRTVDKYQSSRGTSIYG